MFPHCVTSADFTDAQKQTKGMTCLGCSTVTPTQLIWCIEEFIQAWTTIMARKDLSQIYNIYCKMSMIKKMYLRESPIVDEIDSRRIFNLERPPHCKDRDGSKDSKYKKKSMKNDD